MKTKAIQSIAGILSGVILTLATSCEKSANGNSSDQYDAVLEVSSEGASLLMQEKLAQALVVTDNLTQEELAMLLKMKNEEKLARDVYYALLAKWDVRIFSNISNAENNHITAVNTLLKFYGSTDTLIADQGVFTDPEVQNLYNELTTKGTTSVADAMGVGALIEDLDISDLESCITQTQNQNIIMVLENLRSGSRNHLRAFTSQLEALGITYTPVYITADEYNAILASGFETGKQYKMNKKGAVCNNM
jgi:hypothetical protein